VCSSDLENLLRLGYITGNKDFMNIAENSIKYFYPETRNLPFSSPQMLNNILFNKISPKEIIFTGNLKSAKLNDIIKYIHSKYLPFKVLIYANKKIEKYSKLIKKIVKNYDEIKVYVCENQTCKLPVDNTEDLKKII
jgi:hypothetical protein